MFTMLEKWGGRGIYSEKFETFKSLAWDDGDKLHLAEKRNLWRCEPRRQR